VVFSRTVLTMLASKDKMTQAEMASLGGKARAAKLTKQQRSEIARRASQKRWSKKKRGLAR
jgi:hypothetical protein